MTERQSSSQRGYGHKWRVFRENYLASYPLCVLCAKQGRLRAAVELDHIIAHKGDMGLFWNRDNIQGLCKRCHSQKTANGEVVKGFGVDGLPIDPSHEYYRA